jgi:hypothetical protein
MPLEAPLKPLSLWHPFEKSLFLFQLVNVAADSSFTPLKPSKKGKLEGGKHLGKAAQEQTSKCLHPACVRKKNQ